MKKLIAGFLAGALVSGLLSWVFIPAVVVPATVEVTKRAVERAAECAAGYAVTGPASLLINGVELGAGVVDGAIGLGGDLIDLGGGLFGIGGDDDGFKWEEEQLHIAANFLSVGLTYVNHPNPAQRIGEREMISIIAAALAESELTNPPHGHDSSVGALQLLAVHGTFAERMTLEFQARWYFDTLLELMPDPAERDRLSIGTISANVERPAEEYRYKYDERVEEATALYQALSPSLSGSIAIVGSTTTLSYQNQLIDYISDAGWQTVLFDAQSGRQIADAVETVSEWQDEHEPSLWVFDLGEEDLVDVTSVADASALIELIQEPLPDNANQVWVTIDDPDADSAAIFNEALAIQDARTANFNLVPWAEYSADRRAEFLINGQATQAARDQKAAMIGRVAIDPVSFGFDETELGNGGGGFKLELPGACDVGETVLGAAKAAVGAVFNPVGSAQSFVSWAFSERGIEIPEDTLQLLEEADEVDVTEIQPGDLIIYPAPEGEESLSFGDRAIYLGGGEMIREPDVGEVVYIERVNWADEFAVYRLDIQVEINSDIDVVPYEDTVLAEGGFRVHPDLQAPLSRLITQARADGINLGGGAWRSAESQIELRKAHCGTSDWAIYEKPSRDCSPPTARPGSSMHERGLAIDFTCDGVLISSQENSCFTWLAANARSIAGLQNYEVEPWHWSTNGK